MGAVYTQLTLQERRKIENWWHAKVPVAEMAHTKLNLRERRTIEDMLNAKISVGEIAAKIGRHKSTVCREIKRNIYHDE